MLSGGNYYFTLILYILITTRLALASVLRPYHTQYIC